MKFLAKVNFIDMYIERVANRNSPTAVLLRGKNREADKGENFR